MSVRDMAIYRGYPQNPVAHMTERFGCRLASSGAQVEILDSDFRSATVVGFIETEVLRQLLADADQQFRDVARQQGQVIHWLRAREAEIDTSLHRLNQHRDLIDTTFERFEALADLLYRARQALQKDVVALDNPLVLLSKRVVRVLQEAQITHIDQLIPLTDDDLAAIPSIGEKGLAELQNLLWRQDRDRDAVLDAVDQEEDT